MKLSDKTIKTISIWVSTMIPVMTSIFITKSSFPLITFFIPLWVQAIIEDG